MLSFPIKCTNFVSSSFQYGSQSFPSRAAHSFVEEMYPIGASNQTYSFFPSALSTGTSIPQSKSRVTARGFKPSSNQDFTCPYTLGFQSFWCETKIHSRKKASYSFRGKNQCLVALDTGLVPVMVDTGLIKSVALSEVPHFSHWSPYASSLPHFGQVPVTYRSAKNC